MLSTLQIKAAKPAARAFKLADSGGLFLLVQSNGSKLWSYKFRVNGVEGLQAQREAREQQAREELVRAKANFGAVCADWNAATSANLRPATVMQRNREITKDLLPRFKRSAHPGDHPA